jgi:exonuclease SbcC
MRNIRSYKEENLSFPEGPLLLAGDIGSGKSTILQAIEFALFGARRDSISGDAMLRKGATEGEVSLSLEVDGRQVAVSRRLKRKAGLISQEPGYIEVDGSRVEGTATELRARMISLLGYPREVLSRPNHLIYRYTVYTPQEEMKQVLSDSPDDRLDTLRKVFGIDRYKRIAENTTVYLRMIKEERKFLAGQLPGIDDRRKEMGILLGNLRDAEAQRDALIPLLNAARRAKDSAKAELIAAQSALAELNDLRKRDELHDARLREIVRLRGTNSAEMDSLAAEVSHLEEKLSAVFEEKNYPSREDLEQDIARKEQEIAELKMRKASLSERARQIGSRSEDLKSEIASRAGRLSALEEKEQLYRTLLQELQDKKAISDALSEFSGQLKRMEAISAELHSGIKHSSGRAEQVSSLHVCPTCRQEVNEVHKRILIEDEERVQKKLRSELDSLKEEMARISAEAQKHNEKMDVLIQKEQKLATTNVELSHLRSLRSETEGLKESHAKLDEERARILEGLSRLDEGIISAAANELDAKKLLRNEIMKYSLDMKDRIHNKSLLEDRKFRLGKLRSAREEMKNEVRDINTARMRIAEDIEKKAEADSLHRKAAARLESAGEEEKRLEVALATHSQRTEGLNSNRLMLQRELDQKEAAKIRYTELSNLQEWLEGSFLNIIMTVERRVMARIHTQFSELFATWFSLIVDDDALSVRIDETFCPIVSQNGFETSIDYLSGGEKTSVALAYRLALNRVINDIMTTIRTRDILILDEPTDGFSTEQLDRVRSVLEELKLRQMIIVSHEQKVEGFVDSILRVQKSGHVSRVAT